MLAINLNKIWQQHFQYIHKKKHKRNKTKKEKRTIRCTLPRIVGNFSLPRRSRDLSADKNDGQANVNRKS